MQTSKTTKIIVALLIAGVSFLPSSISSAIEGTTSQPQTDAYQNKTKNQSSANNSKSSQNRCQSIAQIVERMQSQLSDRKLKIDSKRSEIALKINQSSENHQTKITEARNQWDEKRQEHFEKLRDKAKTDAQKQAVEGYIVTINEAIKVRRQANDAAFASFRNEMVSIKSSVSQTVEQSISTANSRISQAAANAQIACEGGQSVDTVKQTLKTEIDSARQQVKSNRESISKNEQIKTAVKKRSDAIKTNKDTFLATTNQARQTLLSALRDE